MVELRPKGPAGSLDQRPSISQSMCPWHIRTATTIAMDPKHQTDIKLGVNTAQRNKNNTFATQIRTRPSEAAALLNIETAFPIYYCYKYNNNVVIFATTFWFKDAAKPIVGFGKILACFKLLDRLCELIIFTSSC